MIISNGKLIKICDVVEILNIRITNAITIRDTYTDFSDDDCFRARTKWDGIADELCEIRDEFEALYQVKRFKI